MATQDNKNVPLPQLEAHQMSIATFLHQANTRLMPAMAIFDME